MVLVLHQTLVLVKMDTMETSVNTTIVIPFYIQLLVIPPTTIPPVTPPVTTPHALCLAHPMAHV